MLNRMTTDDTALLVIDLQERLLPAIDGGKDVLAAAGKMIEAARILGVPIVLTEQYPKGLGPTCAAVRAALGDVAAVEKLHFTACVAPVIARLAELGRPNAVVVGVETHVCVQQTVLDLLRLGYRPMLCADAVGSRRPLDHAVAIERMRQAGAVVTTVESAIYELVGQAGTDVFRQILRLVK